MLRHYPINSVSSLAEDEAAVDSDDYVFYENGIIKLKAGFFSNGIQNIEISYNAGYAADNIPATITEASLEIAVLLYKGSDAGEGRLGKASISQGQGGGTLSFINQLSGPLQEALRNHKRIAI